MIRMPSYILSLMFIALSGAHALDYSKEQGNDAMATWAKNTALDENHALLKTLVGKWKVTSKFWTEPNSKPEESKGTQVNKLIMGGRFLQTDHKSTAMGKPFVGSGLLGFDVIRREFQTTWIDSMSTSIMYSTGTYDATTKTIHETGTVACPMTGDKNKWYRAEWRLTDKNNYSYAMYNKAADGQEYLGLEINYKK